MKKLFVSFFISIFCLTINSFRVSATDVVPIEKRCKITSLELIKKAITEPQIGDTLRCELDCEGTVMVKYVCIDTLIVNDEFSKKIIFHYDQHIDTFLWVDLSQLGFKKEKSKSFELNNIVLPTVAYSPESDWKFGIVGAHFFNIDSAALSSVHYGIDYSLNNQWSLFFNSHLNSRGIHPWRLYTKVKISSYPNYFYGVAINKKQLLNRRVPYESSIYEAKIQPQWLIKNTHLYIGPALHFRYEDARLSKKDRVENPQISTITGFSPYCQIGLGAVISYDTRDLKDYPHAGYFMKLIAHQYSKIVLSDYSYFNVDLDLRYYEDFGTASFIWANQLKGVWNSVGQKPFGMLPTLGGMDLMRGMIQNKWRNESLWCWQSEARYCMMPRWYVHIFEATGSVYDANFTQSSIQFTYGMGLRYAVNANGVNLRGDVAQDINTGEWKWYLTVSEAF